MSCFHRIVFACLIISSTLARAEVVSESLVFLKEDGREYVLQRAMRTNNPQYDFYVDKQVGQNDFLYIDPNDYLWDDSQPRVNRLHFSVGSFVVMYPGRFGEQVSVDEKGVYTFKSWDGQKQANGHFGMWNMPGSFDRFVYAWMLPDNLELIDYHSNREGEWVRRNNSLSFFAKDVNDVTITIRYREKDSDHDGVVDRLDRCPDTPSHHAVDDRGCEPDRDHDGVIDRADQCPDTPALARADARGCEIDTDGDGVPDRLDRCAMTPVGGVVDAIGCELDSDNDGVIDRLDQCPKTMKDAYVDRRGCELDFDGDAVVNSRDLCPHSDETAKVDVRGCELDGDKDGVVDSRDRCPTTPEGHKVDSQGCQLDGDHDGVADSMDECLTTPAGAKVDETGCELDSDRDGVPNHADLCPDTGMGVDVDRTGCKKAAPIVLKGVHFHTGSARLTDESGQILDAVATSLAAHPELRLEVAGHTDSQGGERSNLRLSQARAESVRRYLVAHGVPASMLTAMGYGESQPVADNATADGRALNRRVELKRLD